jgi:hypothetical protein
MAVLTSADDVLYSFASRNVAIRADMSVSTLGEAMNSGWRIVIRCAWGKRDAMKSRREQAN